MNRKQQKTTIRKIKNSFEIVKNEIAQLVEDQYYFEKYKEYINKSTNINRESGFLFFIAKNYQNISLINVCKQVDERIDVESLMNVLKKIRNNKNLFTLKWYKKQWKPVLSNIGKKHSRSKEAEEYFREFSTKNNQRVSAQKIDEDIRAIRKAINGLRYGKKRQSVASLRKFRHKRGAHFAKGKPKVNVPVEDLYKAIDLLEKMFLKYNVLITNGGMDSLVPSNIDCFLKLETVFLN